MSEDFGSDFITITSEDGEEFVLEHLDTIEIDGVFYLAFLPTDVDEDSDEYGIIIMKQETENGESYLVIPEEEEMDFAYQRFMERLFEDDDFDEDDEDTEE